MSSPPKKMKQSLLNFAPVVTVVTSPPSTPPPATPPPATPPPATPPPATPPPATPPPSTSSLGDFDPFDIGHHGGVVRPKDPSIKREILLNSWQPAQGVTLDPHQIGSHPKKRAFQHKWFNQYHWLCFSKIKLGGWCKYCLLFDDESCSKKGGKVRGRFVTSGWRDYKKGKSDLDGHENLRFHMDAVAKGQAFLANSAGGGQGSVRNQIDKHAAEELKKLKAVLPSIIEVIQFLAKRGLAFLGDEQDPFKITKENRGNFLDAIDLVRKTDPKLQYHWENCKGNAHHLSPRVQNELIEMMEKQIRESIIAEVKAAKYYSILADETTDNSRKEQLSIALRYVQKKEIKEAFLTYVDVCSTTGANISSVILKTIKDFGLDISDCRGQGYDGASNMRGQFNGVQAHILKECELAVYTHCASHALNLCLVSSCKINDVELVIDKVKEATNFFNESAKRLAWFDRILEKSESGNNIKRLKTLCPTRWTDRVTSLNAFVTLFDVIIDCLTEMSESTDSCKAAAYKILNMLLDFKFIIGLIVTHFVLQVSHDASVKLQGKQNDVVQAYNMIQMCIKTLDEFRKNPEVQYDAIWKQSVDMAERNGVDVQGPRICKRQANRTSAPTSTPKDHFRVNLLYKLLDSFITELRSRFNPINEHAFKSSLLIPSKMQGRTFEDIVEDVMPTLAFYKVDLPCPPESFCAHIMKWELYWRSQTAIDPMALPSTIIETISCTVVQEQFPGIYTLLKIFATLPVTTATVERTFSTLKHIKSDRRTTMGEQRLVGLSLIYVHKKDIDIDVPRIVDAYCLRQSRREA